RDAHCRRGCPEIGRQIGHAGASYRWRCNLRPPDRAPRRTARRAGCASADPIERQAVRSRALFRPRGHSAAGACRRARSRGPPRPVTATAITGTIVPGTLPPNPTPAPSPTPSPAPGGLNQAQLKYRLVDQFGRLLFCDPDYYPVARADEEALAHERLPDIQKDAPTFSAILSHLGVAPAASYTKDQELAIYRDWKMLNALHLDQVGGGFHFLAIFGSPSNQQGTRVDG